MEYGKKSIGFNFIMNAILTVSTFLFPLITFPYVSRVLTPVGTGTVSFATSVLSYFLIIAQLGIPTYGIRACAKVRDKKKELNQTVQEIFCINLIMCVVAYILFFMATILVPRFREERILLIVISATILFNTIGVEWVYKALEMYSYITIRSILFKLIALLGVLFLVKRQEDYIIYGGLTIFASSASNICNFFYLRKFVSLKKCEKFNLKRHIKPISIFFAMSCAVTIYINLDTVMLGFMKSDVDVGYYDAATKVRTILVSIVTSLGAVLLPRVTYYIEQGKIDEFYKIGKKAVSFILFMAIPLMIYFMCMAEQIILLLSGVDYLPAASALRVLAPTILFIGLTNLMGIQMLVPMGKEHVVLKSEVAGAIVDLGINIMLIPSYGATGAAIGTLVAEIVVFVVQYLSGRDMFQKVFRQVEWHPYVVAGLLGWVCLFAVSNMIVIENLLLLILVKAILFFTVYCIVLVVRRLQ